MTKKAKGLVDMDKCSDCWGGECIRGLNGNGKKYNKDLNKIK